MNCQHCGAKPMFVSGYECGTGLGAYPERSPRCYKAQVLNLKDRIKRLEEAGDAMSETTTTPAAEAWRAAKEAKP